MHAFWSTGSGLNLWGEDSEKRVKSQSKSYRSARAHPFALTVPELAEELAAADGAGDAPTGKAVAAALLLPSLQTAPLDSPELVRRRPRPGGQSSPALAPWRVPTVTLAPPVALDVLGRAMPSARSGESLEHLRQVAAFARDLAERGRVVPVAESASLSPDAAPPTPGPVFRARWAPVIQGPDLASFQSLVAALPPVGRAQSATPSDTRGQSPASLVTAAIEELVDAAVRGRLRHSQVDLVASLPRHGGRRPARRPVAEAWLGALTSEDGRFTADEQEAAALAQSLAPWDALLETSTGPGRLLLRVAEPRRPGLACGEEGEDQVEDRWDQDQSEGEPRGEREAWEAKPAQGDDQNTEGGRSGQAAGGTAGAATGGTAGATADGTAADGTAGDQPSGPPPWRVEFLLQSAEDPSLQLPAAALWQGQQALARWLDRPDELLLTELGKASAICPALGDALHQARPERLELDDESLVAFLSESAPLLEQAGFAVLAPSWWTARATLGLKGWAGEPHEGSGAFSKDSLCQFDWRLALGDDPLTDDELALLAAAKTPLVRLRGQWVAFDPDRLARALEFVRDKGRRELTAGEVIGLAAADPEDLDLPLPVAGIGGEGALGALLAGSAEESVEPVRPPAWFDAKLRPYQERGLAWLAFLSKLSLGACLADDMGLGKTVQLLALEASERDGLLAGGAPEPPSRGRRRAKGAEKKPGEPGGGDRTASDKGEQAGHKPTLIVCPMSLVGNWQREAARFAPKLRVYAHHGAGRRRGGELAGALAATDVVVTTYQTAVRDAEDLAGVDWRRVVLDEAQAIKNSNSQAAKTARRLQGGQRVALTGTPMENRLAELRSIMDFLNPGILGSAERFASRYAHPIERYGDPAAAKTLRAVTRPYILRRVKTDKSVIDDLPEKIEMREPCNLTAEQASLYQAVVVDMMEKIDQATGMQRKADVLAAMTKLKQICNHPAQFLHQGPTAARRSGKVTRLMEILDEVVAEGDKALLFTQFTEFGGLLLEEIALRFGFEPLFLHGKVSRSRREEMVASFQSEGGPPLFILSLKAGGTGLNLTAANHVIHCDRWWNPAVEDQATDRAFRIGQKRGVQVRKFVVQGTLEEKIDAMIEEKKALADMVVGAGEGWLTELSTNQLRELFALSERAVGE
jgi:hypothetical protein